MELAERIRTRRSVQVYEDRPVPPGLIEELLDAAVWAPNHHLTQPWRFVVVHGEGRRRIAQANRLLAEQDPAPAGSGATEQERRAQRGETAYARMMSVPAFVVVAMAEDPRPMPRLEDLVATSCVLQNFLLLAAERGLGVAVKSYGVMYHPAFRQALGIMPGESVIAVLQVGYPGVIPAARPRRAAAEVMRIVDTA